MLGEPLTNEFMRPFGFVPNFMPTRRSECPFWVVTDDDPRPVVYASTNVLQFVRYYTIFRAGRPVECFF